eukprot:6288169-Karenia_brevis.AAC.1
MSGIAKNKADCMDMSLNEDNAEIGSNDRMPDKCVTSCDALVLASLVNKKSTFTRPNIRKVL